MMNLVILRGERNDMMHWFRWLWIAAEAAAKELGITYSYFNKVAHKIRTVGFLESVQGPGGGYRIAKDAADITLYDIVKVMEGDIRINRCLEEDCFCSRNATQTCLVHKTLASCGGFSLLISSASKSRG